MQATKRPLKSNNGSSAGFTLIEVLVAATILFMVTAIALTGFQTSMRGSQRSADVVKVLAITDSAQQHIRKALRDRVEINAEQVIEGRTTFLGTMIDWRADLIEQGSPSSRFDPEFEMDTEYAPRFFIYEVHVVLSSSSFEYDLVYRELAWSRRIQVI